MKSPPSLYLFEVKISKCYAFKGSMLHCNELNVTLLDPFPENMKKTPNSRTTKDTVLVMTFHSESKVIENPTEAQVMNTISLLRDSEKWCELRRPGWTIRASRTDIAFQMSCRDINTGKEYQRKPDTSPGDAILDIFLSFRRRKLWSAKLWGDLNSKADRKMAQLPLQTWKKMHAEGTLIHSDGIIAKSEIELNQALSNPTTSWWRSLFSSNTDNLYNTALVCPHCQVKGKVDTTNVKKKVGISGGKATAGLLTGGLSLLAVGLSRSETMTKAHCHNCNTIWHF